MVHSVTSLCCLLSSVLLCAQRAQSLYRATYPDPIEGAQSAVDHVLGEGDRGAKPSTQGTLPQSYDGNI